MPTGDFIDQAIDDAQDSLAETAVDTTPEPTESAPEPTEDLVETAETQKAIEKSQEETSKPSKKRDSSGKFKKASAIDEALDTVSSDQEATAENELEGAQAEESDATPSVNAPAFWSAEQKALFTKAPRDLQEVIASRELMFQQQMSRTANETQRSKAIEQRYREVFSEPMLLKFQAEGLKDGFEGAARLYAWNELFEKDPHTGISDLMRKNGFTAADFAEDEYSQSYDDGQQINDPRIDEALERAERAEKQFEEWKQQQASAEIDRDYQNFKNTKDSLGQPRAQFVEIYEPQIADAILAIKEIEPNMPRGEVLTNAYEYVLGEVRKLHGSVPQAKKPENLIAQANKAKAANGSVTGSPSTGMAVSRSRLKGNNFDEQFESAFEIASSRIAG